MTRSTRNRLVAASLPALAALAGCAMLAGPDDAAVYAPPRPILPGRTEVVEVEVGRAPPGEYRVSFGLSDGERPLPPSHATSAPFQRVPLPDAPAFVCPTEGRAELAARIAEAALALAAGRRDGSSLLYIETLVPGFGGLYVDNGRPTAWLRDLALADELVEAVRHAGHGTPAVRQGDFALSEIVGWTEVVRRSEAFEILGVWGLDADEGRNRVGIAIANELIRADVECLVRGIGMPEGMARIHR